MGYAKAAVGAAIAGLTVLVQAMDDNTITWGEGIGAVVAALVAFGGVWAVRNKPKTGQ